MEVIETPQQVFNWNLTETCTPAAIVHAKSVEDVERVVKDKSRFPSPVLAVGAMHSVNACLTNTGGTLLNMSAMNTVLGLEQHGLRVQCGCKMADIYDWLAKHDLETSFCPEIGDATVGSLVVTTSKDSSIDGPGYLSALVTEVKYVDENGQLMTLTRNKHPAELAAFTCSYGMMGLVVEAVLEVRRRTPITTAGYTKWAQDGKSAVQAVKEARSKCDALFAILVPDRNYVYLEGRNKAKATAVFARHRAAGAVGTLGINELGRSLMINLKYKCFLNGDPLGKKMALFFRDNPFPVFHYRNLFTNRYPEIQPGSRRLDFSYFEFNLPKLDTVLEGCWSFHHEFKAQHGFGPRGYAMYFVNRGYTPDTPTTKGGAKGGADIVSNIVGVQQVGAAKAAAADAEGVLTKPYGNYSKWGPGVSFMMDPITDDADSPLWIAFNEAYTAWAVSMGATPSLSQTKGLKPGQVTLPKHLTRERFLTPYYKSFVEPTP